VPSMILRVGDVVDVKRRQSVTDLYATLAAEFAAERADWISFDQEYLRATVLRLPAREDITLPVDVAVVVELLSR
jgi:small subunit ribosomal protein S4